MGDFLVLHVLHFRGRLEEALVIPGPVTELLMSHTVMVHSTKEPSESHSEQEETEEDLSVLLSVLFLGLQNDFNGVQSGLDLFAVVFRGLFLEGRHVRRFSDVSGAA